eukprot:1160498-Pelagomonas_calceolata.AAC.3
MEHLPSLIPPRGHLCSKARHLPPPRPLPGITTTSSTAGDVTPQAPVACSPTAPVLAETGGPCQVGTQVSWAKATKAGAALQGRLSSHGLLTAWRPARTGSRMCADEYDLSHQSWRGAAG